MHRARVAAAGVLCVLLAVHASHGAAPSGLRRIASTGQAAPGGGAFDRFSVESLPIVAPINSKGQVAFFASIVRGRATEGFYLSTGTRLSKLVADGDSTPGGGVFSGFGRHPVPSLNDAGELAFAATIAGARAVEGIFVASARGLRAVALAGSAAPEIASGTFANLDAPAINNRNEVAFLATVRRGRESVEAIYIQSSGKLRKVVSQGDPAPAGGTFAGFGPPSLNGGGLIAFAAVVEGRAVPGGVFTAKSGAIKMLVGAGEDTPDGGIFAKFSERVALNDAGSVAFNAILKNAPISGGVYMIEDRVRRIAGLGDAAPGGGSFSHFSLWPSLTASGAVVFAASVDGGPAPIAIFVAGRDPVSRVVSVGDALPGGGTLVSFGLHPYASTGSTGAITFATAPDAVGSGTEGVFVIDSGPGR